MRQRLVAEATGTALLLALVVGSGIAAGDLDAIGPLFAHAVVVGVGLAALIAVFQPISGSHFNPAVTLVMARRGAIDHRTAAWYVVAQVGGAAAGVVGTNLMFGLDAVSLSDNVRGGAGVLFSEVVATAVLVMVILVLVDTDRAAWVGPMAGAWILAAIVATSSTAFANPAVALTRSLSDTATGIAPGSIVGFVVTQLIGAGIGTIAAGSMNREGAHA